jgi:integrase
MRAEGENFPKTAPKDLRSLEESELDAIGEAAKKIGGWYGEIARFIMAMYPYSGLRPSELRLAHIDDIDTKKWRIYVRHPKGEGKYARQRFAPILPPARQIVIDYLNAREKHLRELGIMKAVPLIPANHKDGIGFYSETRFRGIKEKVRAMTPGLQFSLKTFRDTFCQMNIDRNPGNLSAVSVLMGHSTTKTTERHYGRMRTEYALDAIQKEWEMTSVKKPMIEIKNQLPGYV